MTNRDNELLLRAKKTLVDNISPEAKEFFDGRDMISPSIKYFFGIWNWDSAFHAMGVAYFDGELAKMQIEGFLSLMKEDGMLPDNVRFTGVTESHSSKPPVFPYAVLDVYNKTNDKEFLARTYPLLCLNEKFWRNQRFDSTGFYYSHYEDSTEENNLLYAKWESGWDNSPRWDNGIENLYPVDLNCFMVMFYNSMEKIADILNIDSKEWAEKKTELIDFVENNLWNSELNAYTDRDRFNGTFSNVLTPASFMPLFIGTASQERAEKMAQIAEDKEKFDCFMPTVSYDNPAYSNDYWRGPMWLNTAYFAAKGLKNYNLPVADKIKENVLSLVYDVGSIRENYDCKNRQGLSVYDFSWSAVFVMEFLLNW